MVIGRFTSHWIKLRKTYIARYGDKVFPGLHEYFPVSEKGVTQSVTQTARKKKIQVLFIEVEPMTFWVLVQILYH